MEKKKTGSLKAQRFTMDIIVHTILLLMAIIWLIPFIYLIGQSFRGGYTGMFTKNIVPAFKDWSLDPFKKLFDPASREIIDFPRMFMNTLKISCIVCVINTFFNLAVSFAMSRLKWTLRKPYMNMAMVIGLFPGFMSMIAIYTLLNAIGMLEGSKVHLALILIYTSGGGLGFYVMKGYMDTIPKALDEAAFLDGATKFQTFIKVTLPLCKPMIVYQVITSFMGPRCDFIMCKLVCGTQTKYYTVAVGLQQMLGLEYVGNWYTAFCAGSLMVALPISILFIITQRFYQEAMSGSVKG